MNFSRYKSEYVADHLREAIRQGDLHEPLPSVRTWSGALGVSTGTLQSALKILKREGWIGSRPNKGFYLIGNPPRMPSRSPIVHWLWHDPRGRSTPPPAEILISISQKLAVHGIGFQIERCDETRLKAIHSAGPDPAAILLFANIGLAYQKLFQELNNALMIGLPFPGIRLPYISSDVFPVFRHAVNLLLRRGCERVELLNIIGRRNPESFLRLKEEFQKIREQAPRPFEGGVTWLPTELTEQCRAIQHLASRVRGKQGLVLSSPILPGLLMMVLKDCGLKIPEQVEILPVNCTPSQMVVYPRLNHYPYPIEQIAKTISNAAVHYFETGALPRLEKLIPLSLVYP